MKRILIYGLLGLLAYAVFLVIQLPAATLVGWLSPQIPQLKVGQVQGTVLNGSAQDLEFRNTRLQSLSWQWQAKALLKGRLAFQVQASDPGLNLQTLAAMNMDRNLELKQLQGRLPLERVVTLAGSSPPLLSGDLDLNLDSVLLDQFGRLLAAQGEIYLLNTQTTLNGSLALGDFKASLSNQETDILVQLQDTGGPVQLKGTLILNPDARYQLKGRLGARDPNDKTLRQTLGILGRPDPDGQWSIEHSGHL